MYVLIVWITENTEDAEDAEIFGVRGVHRLKQDLQDYRMDRIMESSWLKTVLYRITRIFYYTKVWTILNNTHFAPLGLGP